MATEQIPQIEGRARNHLGTRHTAHVRASGQLPAVIYGHNQEPAHVSFDQKQLTDLLHHHAHLIEVKIDAHKEPCLVKDVQWDHLGSKILHIDLARVDLTERVTVEVDLELVGEAIGLKEAGAFLQHSMDEIEVSCLASQIPDRIRVDVSGLGVGESLTIADLKLPSGVSPTDDPETTIASIQIVEEEPEAEVVEAVAAEPEVIKKKEPEGKEKA